MSKGSGGGAGGSGGRGGVRGGGGSGGGEVGSAQSEYASAESAYNAAKAQHNALQAKVKTYNNANNEGAGGFNPHADALKSANQKMAQAGIRLANATRSLSVAKTNAEWTKGVTQSRRESWNSTMKSMSGQKISAQKLAEIEKNKGFTVNTLRDQIKRHGL